MTPSTVLVYAPGNRGLGQVVRATRLAHLISAGAPRTRVLVVTSIPEAPNILPLANSRVSLVAPKPLVQLRQETGARVGPCAEEGVAEAAKLAVESLCTAWKPGAFVSMSHAGLAGEIREILPLLQHHGVRRTLALRDIYWPRRFGDDLRQLSRSDYDAVLVAAPEESRTWLPPELLLGPLADAVRFVGYLAPQTSQEKPSPQSHTAIECQVGGGQDGFALAFAVVSLAHRLNRRLRGPLSFRLSVGPLMSNHDLRTLIHAAGSEIQLTRWFADSGLYGVRPTLRVTMAGYNSCVEAAWSGTRTLLVPRIDESDQEQQIRAKSFVQSYANIATCGVSEISQVVESVLDGTMPLPCLRDSPQLHQRIRTATPLAVAETIFGTEKARRLRSAT
jgi:predicted glycosyltransferase